MRQVSGHCQTVMPGVRAQREVASTWKHALLLVLVMAGTVYSAMAQTGKFT